MNRFKKLLIVAGLMGGLSFAALAPQPASAINVFGGCGGSNANSAVCKARNSDSATGMIRIVVNTLLFLLGMVAVVMIVVGGIRYTTSMGDSAKVKAAKDTILYSVVGLVVAILSFAIVNFVLGQF